MKQTSSPLDFVAPTEIAVIIVHTPFGLSFIVRSGDSKVYQSMPEARDAVRRWLQHCATSDIEVNVIRNFRSPDRFIPKDDSVPGG